MASDQTTHMTLLQKLEALHREFCTARPRADDATLQLPLTLADLWSLIGLLRDDRSKSEPARAWYSVTYAAPLQAPSSYSVTGPGLYGIHEVPALPTEFQAEAMARCLSRAFAAGQRRRSEELRVLLEDGAR